jgi:heptosyltransferase II
MLTGSPRLRRCVTWSERSTLSKSEYDLLINLEDAVQTAEILGLVNYTNLFGAYIDKAGNLSYTEDSKEWFDLSLISCFGKERADQLKFRNRRTYQEILFAGLGYRFNGERYFLPQHGQTDLAGDVAIAGTSGSVWPMKNWAYFRELKAKLEASGYKVNVLPLRSTILEHIADVQNHKCLVSGDTLPMHIALGSEIRCVTIFQCTSPWEIHDYGIQTKIVSPLLEKYFYKRHFDAEATTCIPLEDVAKEVVRTLGGVEYDPLGEMLITGMNGR